MSNKQRMRKNRNRLKRELTEELRENAELAEEYKFEEKFMITILGGITRGKSIFLNTLPEEEIGKSNAIEEPGISID